MNSLAGGRPGPRDATPQQPLADWLKTAAAELAAQAPPAELQARVRAGVRAARQPAAPRPWWRRVGGGLVQQPWAWSGGAAFAALLVGSAVLTLRLPPPLPLIDDGLRQGGFVPVVPADRWPRDNAPAWLVSTELQGERLASLGLPFDPARAGQPVRAELLMHASGEVLAVRLLN